MDDSGRIADEHCINQGKLKLRDVEELRRDFESVWHAERVERLALTKRIEALEKLVNASGNMGI